MRLFCCLSTIKVVFADGAYSGTLIQWAKAMFGWAVTVVKREQAAGFVVLPKRSVVERSLAWLNGSRRLAKDYEVTSASSEAFVYIASLRLLVRRLAAL